MENKLDHYLKTWNLSDPQPLAATATSHVYTVAYEGETAVLKLLTPVGDEEKVGAIALDYWGGHGAVRLLRCDDQAHLLEYASGENLVPLVKRGEDTQATEIIADVLTELHASTSAPPEGLYPLKRWFRSLFMMAETDRHAGIESVFVRAARIAEGLLDDPREVRVLHGDIHHENIRFKAGRGWLAFDPKGLLGERTFDVANTFCNPLDMQQELIGNEARVLTTAMIFSEKLKIDPDRLLAFTFSYLCLSASWIREDGKVPADELQIAALIEPHLKVR
ncbi:MAG: aminoglycoside phosphotransferase family protein [Chloroflexota bacterium]